MDKVVVLAGPTGVGKTKLSIELAKRINAEIISADSMQIYKGMDIGTAKIKKEEMDGIVHYMIDIVNFDVDYDVSEYKKTAGIIINDIISRGKIPLIVGGTGFYIQALIYDVDYSNDVDFEYRDELNNIANHKGNEALYNMLLKVDPDYALITHKNNRKRVIRALEFYHTNKYPLSKHNNIQKLRVSPFDLYYFVLNSNRQKLYDNIDKRVDIMMNDGFLSEVCMLKDLGIENSNTAKKALGYSELLKYLNKEYSLEKAVYNIKLNTRHFAKRQLTWFNHERDARFINKDNFDNEKEIVNYIEEIING